MTCDIKRRANASYYPTEAAFNETVTYQCRPGFSYTPSNASDRNRSVKCLSNRTLEMVLKSCEGRSSRSLSHWAFCPHSLCLPADAREREISNPAFSFYSRTCIYVLDWQRTGMYTMYKGWVLSVEWVLLILHFTIRVKTSLWRRGHDSLNPVVFLSLHFDWRSFFLFLTTAISRKVIRLSAKLSRYRLW